MRLLNRPLTLVSALVVVLAAPAGADEVTAVTSKLGSAAAGVKSFVVELRVNGTTGVNGTLTFVRPLSIKSEFSMGPMALESYVVDGTLYMRSPAGGWQKTRIDVNAAPQLSANIAESLKSAKVTLLPDRQEDGATVGVVSVEAKLPSLAGTPAQSGAQQTVCSYDKVSFLLRICTNSLMTMTYTKYNDPANIVVLPAAAKQAVPMILPSTAPAAAPPPPPSVTAPSEAAPSSAPASERSPSNDFGPAAR